MLDLYKNIVVTGGCGFIGSHLVSKLISMKKEVIVVDNLSTSYNALPYNVVKLVKHDIVSRDGLSQHIKDAEIIFHLAGNSNGSVSVIQREYDHKVNAIGTRNILECAKEIRVKRFIYLSTASVYGKAISFPIEETHPTVPILPYGQSKLEGEQYCQSFLRYFPVVIARPFCVYGAGENPKTSLVEVTRYLRWHLNHQPIQIVGNSIAKTRDFVHVHDVVSALILLADKAPDGQIFNVGTGREVSMSELVDIISSVSGRYADIREITHITEDSFRLVPDISRIKKLGYIPRLSLEDSVRELIDFLGENPELPQGMTIFNENQTAESF